MNIRSAKRLAIATAVLGSLAIVSAAAAALPTPPGAPGGVYKFNNATKSNLVKSMDGYDQVTSKTMPTQIPAGSTAVGEASSAVGTMRFFVGTTWTDPKTGYGCDFITGITYNYMAGKYFFSIFARKVGGASSPAKCSITATTNPNTGKFTAYPVISGF